MLPSNYTPCYGLGHRYFPPQGYSIVYIDTGVKPKNTLSAETILWTDIEAYEQLFGARDTNSTTSTGSFYVGNLSRSNYGNTYFGWNDGRANMGRVFCNEDTNGKSYIKIEKNNCLINKNNRLVVEASRTSATFTGNQNIYLLCLNNAGTPFVSSTEIEASSLIYTFKLYDNDTLIRDYVPCYDGNNYGFYDYVNNTFQALQGNGRIPVMGVLDVTTNGNGEAYAKVEGVGYVNKVHVPTHSIAEYPTIQLTARPNDGYVFLKWKENGVDYSTEDTIDYLVTADTTMEAVFVKKTDLNASTGFKLMGLEYGGSGVSYFADVISGNVQEDSTSRSTSTFVLKSVPSGFIPNIPIFLFNPKGKVIYCGIIKSVENNTVTCREPNSVFDLDYVFSIVSSNTDSIIYSLRQYMADVLVGNRLSNQSVNALGFGLSRITQNIASAYVNEYSSGPNKNINATTPLIAEAKIENLEEFIFNVFNDFGVYVKPSLSSTNNGRKVLKLFVINPKLKDTLVFGNNMEFLQNLSVDISETENTVLIVLDETMTSVRGRYAVKTDGSIVNNAGVTISPDYIAYTRFKPKVVASDDKLRTIVEQNLNNALYNHKITFDIDLNNKLLTFDDLEMARPVVFYQDNKVYNSMITAREFTINENDDEIRSIKITLGRVRNKLTTKINLKKLK